MYAALLSPALCNLSVDRGARRFILKSNALDCLTALLAMAPDDPDVVHVSTIADDYCADWTVGPCMQHLVIRCAL
jgi:hypothetical protein